MSSLQHEVSTAPPPRQRARAELVGSMARPAAEDESLAKLDKASRYIDVAQLTISPQWGFSSAVAINDAEDIQWRKIDVMCRVADRLWGRASPSVESA